MNTDTKEIYREWIDRLWNGPDSAEQLSEAAKQLVTDEFVGHWPGRDVHGPEGLAQLIAETKAMFSELSFKIEVAPLADADMVAARWIGTGTTTDCSPSRFFGNDILRIRDGRFCEYWVASAEG